MSYVILKSRDATRVFELPINPDVVKYQFGYSKTACICFMQGDSVVKPSDLKYSQTYQVEWFVPTDPPKTEPVPLKEPQPPKTTTLIYKGIRFEAPLPIDYPEIKKLCGIKDYVGIIIAEDITGNKTYASELEQYKTYYVVV